MTDKEATGFHKDTDVNTSEPAPRGSASDVLVEMDFMPAELGESVRALFCSLYVVVTVLGVSGNSVTLLVVLLNRELRTVTTNVFLLSLAVSDALIAAVNVPLHLRLFVQHNEWTLGQVACKLAAYTQGVLIVSSILTLVSLAIDRYNIHVDEYICPHEERSRYCITNKSSK